jgi:nitrogenase molybdenum-iron protein alpha/beta subunit
MEPLLGCGLAGILKATVGIDRALAIVHGPMSCASGHRIIPLFADQEPLVPSTALTEIDVIMGTEEKLREAVLKANEIYHPSLLVIMLTCATSMISEVYDPALAELRENLECPILLLDGSGIVVNEIDSYLAFHRAFDDLLAPQSEPSSAATIVELAGLSSADYGIGADLSALEGLLGTALAMNVGRVLFHRLNISGAYWPIYPRLPVGRLWMDTAVPSPAPFGIAGTQTWVKEAATRLGVEVQADFDAQLAQAEADVSSARASLTNRHLRVGIEAESWWGVGLAKCLVEEMGCQVFLSSDEGAGVFQDEYGGIATTVVDVGNLELVEHLREFGAQVVFGSSYAKAYDWIWYPFWQPIWHLVEGSASLMGLRGLPRILAALAQTK